MAEGGAKERLTLKEVELIVKSIREAYKVQAKKIEDLIEHVNFHIVEINKRLEALEK